MVEQGDTVGSLTQAGVDRRLEKTIGRLERGLQNSHGSAAFLHGVVVEDVRLAQTCKLN